MTAWFRRHLVFTWAIAWGVTGMGLFIAGIGNDPRQGPIWTSVVFGTLVWAWAGALTFHGELRLRGLLIWGLSYATAYGLAALWAWGYTGNDGMQLQGTILAWSLGTVVGPLMSGYSVARGRYRFGPVLLAVTWGLICFVATWISIIPAYMLPDIMDRVMGHLVGERFALTLGVGLGTSVGGILVGAAGLKARDWIIGALGGEAPYPEMP